MSISVMYQEAPPTQIAPSATAGQTLPALAAVLFTSDLSALREHTTIEVATAIRHAIDAHHGIGGCVAEVAASYGEHPETAACRMRWAITVIKGINATAGRDSPGDRAESGDARGTSLVEQGYVPACFGGIPVLVGPTLAAQLRALREKQP